jgi:hypothetical protein
MHFLLRAFDPSQPRDEHGRWSDGGGGDGGGVTPAESPGETGGEKLLLVSERPNQERLNKWNKQINERQEELNQQGKTGESEDEQLNGMSLSLSAYSQEDEKNLDSGRSGLNVIYDGDIKLLAAAFTDVKGNKAKIEYFGAIDRDAHKKVLDQITKAFGDKVETIEIQRWKDDPSLSLFKEAGFEEKLSQGAVTNLSAVMLEKRTAKNLPSLEHVPVPVQIGEGSGNEFKSELISAITTIPAPVLKTMASNGVTIRAGTRMTELNPELKGVHPRGWPAGMTWDSAEGGYNTAERALSVAETLRPAGSKAFVRSTRIRGVVLHESGHAFDHSLGYMSRTPSFIDAYKADVRGIPKETKDGLRYYLQKGNAGPSEAFAEIFAWNAGDAGAGRDIRQHFPRVSALVKQAIEGAGAVG